MSFFLNLININNFIIRWNFWFLIHILCFVKCKQVFWRDFTWCSWRHLDHGVLVWHLYRNIVVNRPDFFIDWCSPHLHQSLCRTYIVRWFFITFLILHFRWVWNEDWWSRWHLDYCGKCFDPLIYISTIFWSIKILVTTCELKWLFVSRNDFIVGKIDFGK